MKNANLRIIAAIIVVATLMSGCGLGKMIKKYNLVKYEVVPNPLETHGGKINATFKGTIPAKYFHPMATVELTPVLKYDGGETAFKPILLRGEKTTGPDGTVITKTGGSFNVSDVIDYNPAMNKSVLYITAKAKLKKKEANLGIKDGVKIADGVIYTSTRVGKDEETSATFNHNYKKEEFKTERGNIYFAYNKSNLDMNLANNKDAGKADALKGVLAFITNGWKIKDIAINAWASPEGEETLNQKLSDQRAVTADKYVKDQVIKFHTDLAKANKEKFNKKFEEIYPAINKVARGEDWDGFQTALQNSNIQDKNAILNVIRSQPNKAKREQEIRNMSVIYKEIEDGILSQLRRAEITVTSYLPKKTDAQISEFSTTNPNNLDKEEILYAATLTEDINTKYTIYKNATQVHADDWRGYNNAGYCALQLGKTDEAAPYLEKANSLSPNNGAVLNNLGVVAAWKGDYENAMSYFEQAQQRGTDASYNIGILLVRKGQYPDALAKFAGKSCKYNIGLAHLVSQNFGEAQRVLECAPQTPANFYLLAIVGARTNNTALMYDNLKKAIAGDPAYRDQAKDDREFIKYFNDSDFQNAIK